MAMDIVDDFREFMSGYAEHFGVSLDDDAAAYSAVTRFLEVMSGDEDFSLSREGESDAECATRVTNFQRHIAPILGAADVPSPVLARFAFEFWAATLMVSDSDEPLEEAATQAAITTWLSHASGDEIVDELTGQDGWIADALIRYLGSRPAEHGDQVKRALEAAAQRVVEPESRLVIRQIAHRFGDLEREAQALTPAVESIAYPTVAEYFASDARTLKLLTKFNSEAGTWPVVTALTCRVEPHGGGQELVLFLPSHVLLVPVGLMAASPRVLSAENGLEIQLGSRHHVQAQGFTSTESNHWTLTFITGSGSVYTRYLPLGTGENRMNANRERYLQHLRLIAQHFDIDTDGEHIESSAGYTQSFGIGVWSGFD